MQNNINKNYTNFYKEKKKKNIYPTEFVVRTFLASYPELDVLHKEGDKVLDIGFGDGRNSIFLANEGYSVYGIEITSEIVNMCIERFSDDGLNGVFKVGRNNNIPFKNSFFDTILACHSSYYLDRSDSFEINLLEISRVLKKNGYFITSLPNNNSYVLKDGVQYDDGSIQVKKDPYNNRNGCRLQSFKNIDEIEKKFSSLFHNFSFGFGHNNWYGIDEQVFWVVCQKK
jgi:ubiquinone/menaquinone biosynthesis C-methylase UbiE